MPTRIYLGDRESRVEYEEGDTEERFVIAEAIREGGPRSGLVFGWTVLDREHDAQAGAYALEIFKTRDEAESKKSELIEASINSQSDERTDSDEQTDSDEETST